MREILQGVFTWPWFSERFGYDFNGWWIDRIVIDPVEMKEPTLLAIEKRGTDAIVLTNRNHFRAAERVRERTGAKVLVHPADAEFVKSKGVTIGGELPERVGPFTIVGAPGKSPGEVVLHWPERRILLVGDACVGPKPGVLGLLPEAVMDDPPRLRESLRKLCALDFDTILCADGHSILTGGREALQTLVASFA
jgi:glyoxylase-like metal-dependent hydrolase (beta-lactamase superfamily II)